MSQQCFVLHAPWLIGGASSTSDVWWSKLSLVAYMRATVTSQVCAHTEPVLLCVRLIGVQRLVLSADGLLLTDSPSFGVDLVQAKCNRVIQHQFDRYVPVAVTSRIQFITMHHTVRRHSQDFPIYSGIFVWISLVQSLVIDC